MNTTFNKILLSQNDFLIENAIKHNQDKLNMLTRLAPLLNPFGLDAGEVKKLSWNEIDNLIKDTFLFPNATEEHNLNCLGLAKEFHDLKEYYRLNTWCFDAKVLTETDKNAIVEQYRTYTSNENQNEAIHLFNTVKDSLLRLKELNVPIDMDKTYLVSRVLIGSYGVNPPLKIESEALHDIVIKLQ